jgi:small subunit ribosomal protein S17
MPKRMLQGVVVSDKGEKTIVVKVERRFTHPVLKKTVRRSKNYHAHDENNAAKVGDTVSIVESRPYSKTKTWKLVDGREEGVVGGLVSSVVEGVSSVVDRVKSAVGLS